MKTLCTLLLASVVIACPRIAQAQNLKIPAALFVTSSMLDATTTHHILATGGIERNPLLAVWKTPNRITTAMIGGDLAIGFAAYKLRNRHPRISAVLLYSAGSVHLACGSGNVGVIAARP